MSKRQADYLSSLLGDAAETSHDEVGSSAQSSAIGPGKPAVTLLARESALARVAAGEVKQVTQLLLDPARVRIWQGNPRHQASLTEESCRDLIDAILAEGGQKVPAIVRRVTDDPAHEYEVIAGTRRHWAISWLRANSYPEMSFLAQVYALDDEAAFRISDIENRARKDVSDFERARTYLRALDLHYQGKQARMAERLHVSKGWLSKLLTVATLPDWIAAAFASPADIQLKSCYPLAQKISALTQERALEPLRLIRSVSEALAAEQGQRRGDGRPSLAAADVIARLMMADQVAKDEGELIKFDMPTGRTALSVLSANRNGISIRLHAGSGASVEDLASMLKEALVSLDAQGKGLKS